MPVANISVDETNMVKPQDSSSDTEHANQPLRKHGRTSSSDQAKSQVNYTNSTLMRSIEPASPNRSQHNVEKRPQNKRRKSSASSKHKTRPGYSRKYSTPPSRPLSPSGYPQVLDPDMVIPEIDLNQANHHLLQVDTAPQEPDLWSDPETDYFSTVEGPAAKHMRGKSRRQLSQNLNNTSSLNAVMAANAKGLQQISEDAEAEYSSPRIPGAFGA